MQWYYAINGHQSGPVEQDEIESMLREGRLKPDDLVWNTGMGNQWAKASAAPGLGVHGAGLPGGAGAAPEAPWSDAASFESRTSNRELMAQARNRLDGNWGLGVLAMLICGGINLASSMLPFAGGVISLLVGGPIALGLAILFLAIARSEGAQWGMLFDGFRRFGDALGAYLLVAIFTLLWTLLLIVPGIIAAISYSMTYFILRDDHSVGPLDAIRRSKKMMQGNKWKFFCLQWRFFWWTLLCVLTCGIGFLWLQPYIMTSAALFYEDLKQGRNE